MTETERFDPRLCELNALVRTMADPQTLYSERARTVRAERANGVVTLYCYDDIVRVNRHPDTLGTGGRGPNFGSGNPLIPLEIDGAEHRKWRRLLDPIFGPKQVTRLQDSVRDLAGELIDNFAMSGSAELHDSYCVPLPCLIFLRLVGAPVEDLDFFLEFKEGVLHPRGDTMEELEANVAVAAGKLIEYFTRFLAQRRAEGGGEDIIGILIRSEVEGQPLTDAELLNIMFLLMFAGLDTVTGSLSCIFAWLGRHPKERDRLVADPSLIPAAVEELLRFESPVPSGIRYAEADIDLGDGLVIKAGEAIHAIWAAANVDPAAYPNPLEVAFDRGRVNHIAFASGTHRCLGSHLARMELRIAVAELLARIPDFVVDVDGLTYDNSAVRVVGWVPITFTAPQGVPG